MENFLHSLVNKVYKILPLREEENPFLTQYIESLCVEAVGAGTTYPYLGTDRQYIDIVNTLHYLSQNTTEVRVCKREVFKMIRLINKTCDRVSELPQEWKAMHTCSVTPTQRGDGNE